MDRGFRDSIEKNSEIVIDLVYNYNSGSFVGSQAPSKQESEAENRDLCWIQDRQ